MVVRKHKSNENYLIDFLSSAPVGWKPASDEVLMNCLVVILLTKMKTSSNVTLKFLSTVAE